MATDIMRYDNNGNCLGLLKYDEAIHEENLQNADTLTVTCREYVSKNDRLVWQDNSGSWHEHVVDEAVRNHDGSLPRTVAKCSNSISELYGMLQSGTKDTATVDTFMGWILAGTRWTNDGCSDFGVVDFEMWHKNKRACIGELCELVKGELVTRIIVGENGVTHRFAAIVSQRGFNSVMRQFRYGRNVAGVRREVAQDEVYTAIKAYGAKADLATLQARDTSEMSEIEKEILQERIRALQEDDYAERITVSFASNRKDASALLQVYGVHDIDGNLGHHWLTYTDTGCTDGAFLAKQARKVLAAYDHPLIRYEFDVAQVEDDMWSDVRLGNRVLCVDELFDPAIELDERVSYIRRSLSGRMSCRIAIGERPNPMVEQYKAASRMTKAATGNIPKVYGDYPSHSWNDYIGDGYAAPGWTADGLEGGEAGPASIAVLILPVKTKYVDGEDIVFTGLSVAAFDSEGNLFTNDAYPNGTIPFSELIFPVTKADIDESARGGIYSDGNGVNALYGSFYQKFGGLWLGEKVGTDSYYGDIYVSTGNSVTAANGTYYLTKYNGNLYCATVGWGGDGLSLAYKYDDENAAIRVGTSIGASWSDAASYSSLTVGGLPESTVPPSGAPSNMQLVGLGQSVPVQWRYGSQTFETSFNIIVETTPVSGSDIGGGETPNPWGDPSILYPELYG